MKKYLLFLFIIISIIFPAHANDTSGYILPTGGVVFEKQDGIRMQTEALYIRPGRIEVNYLFENTMDKDITTLVFFPLPLQPVADNSYGEYRSAFHQFHFELQVDGKAQKYDTHLSVMQNGKDITSDIAFIFRFPEESFSDWDFHRRIASLTKAQQEELTKKGFIRWGGLIDFEKDEETEGWVIPDEPNLWQKQVSYRWTQSFPAQQTVTVKHVYIPASQTTNVGRPFSTCIDQNSEEYEKFISANPQAEGDDNHSRPLMAQNYLEYILTTANNWQGSIENFNLLIESPLKSMGCFNKEPFWGQKRFAQNLQNYTPAADLSVDFVDTGYIKNFRPSTPELYRIDGPANVRQTPGGLVSSQLENNTYVWVWPEEKQKNWHPVLQNNIRGYTHKQNLIKVFK